MKIALFAPDSKYPNIAIMKISAWHKAQGDTVVFQPKSSKGIDKTYVSIILTQSRKKARQIASIFPNTDIGGTGWEITKELPAEIEAMQPDYRLLTATDLYPMMRGAKTREQKMLVAHDLTQAGIGFSSRGCINTVKSCPYCVVPLKEKQIKHVMSIRELMNPVSGSKLVYLLDNAFVSDPYFFEKMEEIRELDLTVDIQSGIDLRRLDDEHAHALASIKHRGSLRMAWDNPAHEASVVRGIRTLRRHYKGDSTCYVLIGFNTSPEQDIMRVRKLHELGVRPYIMRYSSPFEEQEEKDTVSVRNDHFKRYVNGFVYKREPFENYEPWVKQQQNWGRQMSLELS